MDELEMNNQAPEPTPAVEQPLILEKQQARPVKRPPRGHASKSLMRRRIKRLIDMYLLGVDDEELLIESLQKNEGIERRQAKRYLAKAHQELEKAGTGISPRDWGVKMKQADSLLSQAYREAQREGGDRAAAIQAHKNAVSTMTTLEKIKKATERGDNHDHHSENGRATEEDRLAEILRFFVQEQSAGESDLPG